MEIDSNGLEVLDRDECLRLMGTATMGRIALTVNALPVVLPVNFVLSGDEILIRTGEGTKLQAATRNAVVAIEVDEVDLTYHTGWSVVVTGRAREVTDPAELAGIERLPLPHWAPLRGARVVGISTEIISGRRITRDQPAPVVTTAPGG